MKTLLICHEDDPMNRIGLARWLASFSDLAGIVLLHETFERKRKRIEREIERSGKLRFADILAFRAYYKVVLSRRDRAWERDALDRLCARYAPLGRATEELHTPSPNTAEAEAFVKRLRPDLLIARCKTLLASRIFSVPAVGAFVMHPGICPEYRNAHGCFWALARGDTGKVGMTLLKIDKGVDTGPVYGYYTYPYDERRESHIVIQHRVVFENLDTIRTRIEEIYEGRAAAVDVAGRPSGAWGQPWLTEYLRWKWKALTRIRSTT